MTLTVATYRSIHDVDPRDWSPVCNSPNDLLMQREFLAAAEASMRTGTAGARSSGVDTEFWYVVACDEGGAVGAACVTEFPLDTMVFASPLARCVVGIVRRVFPRYLKFRVTWCGLPISTAGSNFRILAGADVKRVTAALNDAVEAISRERQTWLVVYKELDEAEARRFATLEGLGYVRAESLPMNRIVRQFPSFDAMLSAMRSHYRYKIAKSRKKLLTSRLSLRRTSNCDEITACYSPALHAMYERVTLRSEHRLEVLPREFFLELALRFNGELILTTIHHGDRVIAFAWSLRHGAVYRNLFVGIDDDYNEESDAYFNLMVEDVAHGMSQPVDEILVGQTAEDFKSRLGCMADPRCLLIKVTNGFLRWWFNRFQSTFLTPPPPAPQRDVFRHEEPANSLDPQITIS
ncbi:MAG: GNAT family N-acetyltransferase [Pirellulales bacterium]